MKINNSTKKSLLIIALAMASTTYQTQAAPIEHIGDRYIMHVPEMELTGEESLLDVLMMCPEVISLDGNNIIGGDPFANLYGKFVIRIDNQEYGLDYATFLHHFKAREIETIKVCQNAEVMKGCSLFSTHAPVACALAKLPALSNLVYVAGHFVEWPAFLFAARREIKCLCLLIPSCC